MSNLFSFYYNQSHIEFAAWLGFMNCVYKAILCISRYFFIKQRVEDPDRLSAPIAGFCAGMCIRLNSDKSQRNFIMSLLMSRLLDTVLNKVLQDAYKSKEDEDRINEGHNRISKQLVIMTGMVLALVHNLFCMVYYPNLNNPSLVRASLRYCGIVLDDGFGFIVKTI